MQKIFGFVAEFNPFHNGHKLFIDEIKKKYHPDVLIAVMSGNFVQRGDFAVLDKWQRTQIAIENGVDLVVELPFSKAVQPSNLFAEAAIKILSQMGVTDLVFGSESQIDFLSIAKRLGDLEFKQEFNQNYAQNYNQALLELGVDTENSPNKLLGINYVAAIENQHLEMNVHTILRKDQRYSATKIRNILLADNDLSYDKLVPGQTFDFLKHEQLFSWENFYPYLRYNILTKTVNDLQLMYQMVEGLNFKLKKEIGTSDTFEQFLYKVKSKRYTLARIRRLLMYVLNNVDVNSMERAFSQDYLRVLGFDSVGQKYLNNLKKQTDIPLITRVGKQEQELMALDLRADTVYQLVTNKEQNYGMIPYIKEEQ